MNRKGFTLVELIMSVLFIAVIFTTITAMWAVSSGIFSSTSSDTVAHNDAMAYEGILRGAVLPAKNMEVKASLEEIGSPEEEAWGDYLSKHVVFGFYLDYYSVSYFADQTDYTTHTVLPYDTLDSVDQVQIRFLEVGGKNKMEYKIGKKENSQGYWVEGGIMLDHLPDDIYGLQQGDWRDLEDIGFLCFER